jgi:hypothetical protein
MNKDSVRKKNTLHIGYKNQSVDAKKENFAVCSEVHTKHVKAM